MQQRHSHRPVVWRRSHTILALGAAGALMLAAVTSGVAAQDDVPPPLDPAAPLADPVLSADAEIAAQRAVTWQSDHANMLLLEGDALFRLGDYGFRARRAVLRSETVEQGGRRITHLAAYLEDARPLAGGAVGAGAPRLLVTASTRGSTQLQVDALRRIQAAPDDPIVADALDRIARHRRALQETPVASLREVDLFGPPAFNRREARRSEIAQQQQLAAQVARLPEAELPVAAAGEPGVEAPRRPAPAEAAAPAPEQAILPTQGVVYLAADRITGTPQENAAMLIGDVRVVYQDTETGRDVAITAERAVVFTRDEAGEESAITGGLQAGNVTGVYLEDNAIITYGDFTLRAPRMYYDLEQNRAILLEAVFYTFDLKRQIPLYVRADVLRQTSATSFEAQDALLTTSEFAEPHVAIASDRVVINRLPEDTGGGIDSFAATGNTIEVGGTPVFYWPFLAGTNRDVPLRRIRAGYSDEHGPRFESTWDLFALAGRERPPGVDLTGDVDYLGDHGPALGLNLEYEQEDIFGRFDGYFLPHDDGEDILPERRDIRHDGETRGYAHWQHRSDLEDDWELSLEASYISDPTFLEAFFEDEAYTAREYETSAYLKKQEEDWALTALAKYNANDFVPQLTTLQAPGFTVDKLPELGYHRVGTALWQNRLTYFSETTAARLRLRPGDNDPDSLGFNMRTSQLIFGIDPDVDFDDAAEAAGLPLGFVTRFDTRHEVDLPLKLGFIDATPYAAARLTAYDDDFQEYSGEDDPIRLWGQIGARFSAAFSRNWDGVESDLFDVHRLRHIVRPSVDLFLTGTTLDSENLPNYDQTVEGINDASGVRLGLTNTFETQRGGPGRWRSVEWIVLETDLVFLNEEGEEEPGDVQGADLARFFDYRPEYSVGGDHFYTELLWLLSDTFGVTGELTYSFDSNQVVQWRLGASMQHTPRLSSFVEFEELDVLQARLLDYGLTYQLTTKYRVALAHRLDLGEGDSRRLSFSLERKLPRWSLQLVGSYDELKEETTVGLVLIPQGFETRSPRLPLDPFISAF